MANELDVPDPYASLLDSSAQSRNTYQTLMGEAVAEVVDWLAQPQLLGPEPTDMRKPMPLRVEESGMGPLAALSRASEGFLKPSVKVHHPWCAAHLHCPVLTVSQVAEVLVNAANQSLDSWDQSPSATHMELELISWLCRFTGYAEGGSGTFTSGGTQSNLMGLMLARDRLVAEQWGRSVRQAGLPCDAHRIKVLCSAAAHFSVSKNCSLLGLGTDAVIPVATDAQDRMSLLALEQELDRSAERGELVAAIVATAGTTDAGAIDPLDEITAIAQRRNIWLHVDAAWGGALLFSPEHRARVAGLRLADSITLDFHKALLQPIACGAFLLRDAAHFELMRTHADYLNPECEEQAGIPNLVSRSLQTTRRFDALKVWMTLEAIGTRELGHMIDRCIRTANQLAAAVEASPAFELVMPPQLSSVLFRLAGTEASSDSAYEPHRVVARSLLEQGVANIGATRHAGRTCFKLTLLNPQTELVDLLGLLDRLESTHAGRTELELAI